MGSFLLPGAPIFCSQESMKRHFLHRNSQYQEGRNLQVPSVAWLAPAWSAVQKPAPLWLCVCSNSSLPLAGHVTLHILFPLHYVSASSSVKWERTSQGVERTNPDNCINYLEKCLELSVCSVNVRYCPGLLLSSLHPSTMKTKVPFGHGDSGMKSNTKGKTHT